MTNILGIVGGLGPLASAEFVKTIYEYNVGDIEQDSPIVLLHSDPSFPDRTEAFIRGDDDPLLAQLIESLDKLLDMGATQLVICCITMHYLTTRLPVHLQEKLISLVDVALMNVVPERGSHLLICSNGTRAMRIFERNGRWPLVHKHIVMPDEADQSMIHGMLYRAKRPGGVDLILPDVEALLAKYRVNSLICGCTEMHPVTKHIMSHTDRNRDYVCIVDPLLILAQHVGVLAHE